MTILAGRKVDAVDFDLPDVVTGYGNGTNTITATSFAQLPSVRAKADITNPHPTANMLCLVTFGAWVQSTTSSDVRAAIDVSGATIIAAGVGGGGSVGWGETLFRSNSGSPYGHDQATITVELAPGLSTLEVFAYRAAASGTHQINYATVRIVPLRYLA